MESWLFLALVLAIAIFGKNTSLIIASVVVMVLKLLPLTTKWLPVIQNKGINWGGHGNFRCHPDPNCNWPNHL